MMDRSVENDTAMAGGVSRPVRRFGDAPAPPELPVRNDVYV